MNDDDFADMPGMEWSSSDDLSAQDVHFAADMSIGFGDDASNELVGNPAMRPVGGVAVLCGARDHQHGVMVLASWRLLSKISGQLEAFRGSLPLHLQDQWQARAGAEAARYADALRRSGG